MIHILKSGKSTNDPHSYRPIRLLSATGELLEKIVYKQLLEFVWEKNLLPDYQFGFRRGHSTTHQATRIKQHICIKIRKKNTNRRGRKSNRNRKSNPFDLAWKSDFLTHQNETANTYLVRMIPSFIRNRKFAVHINDSTKNKINIQAGSAQGTCISSTLYALFAADIPIENRIEAA